MKNLNKRKSNELNPDLGPDKPKQDLEDTPAIYIKVGCVECAVKKQSTKLINKVLTNTFQNPTIKRYLKGYERNQFMQTLVRNSANYIG